MRTCGKNESPVIRSSKTLVTEKSEFPHYRIVGYNSNPPCNLFLAGFSRNRSVYLVFKHKANTSQDYCRYLWVLNNITPQYDKKKDSLVVVIKWLDVSEIFV